jgi:hypothetical protein
MPHSELLVYISGDAEPHGVNFRLMTIGANLNSELESREAKD